MSSPPEAVIRLQWRSIEDVPTLYANNLYIVHTATEFFLVFGEVTPPVLTGEAHPPEYIEIKPVAKIAVSLAAMPAIAQAIHDNVERFLTGREGSDKDAE